MRPPPDYQVEDPIVRGAIAESEATGVPFIDLIQEVMPYFFGASARIP